MPYRSVRPGASTEWIQKRPHLDRSLTTLAAFTPTTFTGPVVSLPGPTVSLPRALPGDHRRQEPVVTSGPMIPASEVDPARLLQRRRASIDEVYDALEALGDEADPESVGAIVADALGRPSLGFLSILRGGPERLVAQSVEEYRRFVPSEASNAASAAGLVRILLLQNVDLLWWDDEPDFSADADVAASSELVDLVDERRRGRVGFSFGVASDSWTRRGRDFMVQRLLPRHEPRGPGLSCTRVRPAMLGMLNEVATAVLVAAPVGTPAIRVTSITRTVEHQQRLRALGFSALLPSAHCRGWAADIEVGWFERFGADGALRGVLLDYLDQGILNVIDEGRAWHVCLNPDQVGRYLALGVG